MYSKILIIKYNLLGGNMKKYKSILISVGWFFIALIVYLLFVTTLAHFNIITYKTVSVMSFIFMCLLFMFNGFKIGKRSQKRGYLSGLFIGGINIVLVLFLALIFRSLPQMKSLIYFATLLLSSTLGGMFGINFKRN